MYLVKCTAHFSKGMNVYFNEPFLHNARLHFYLNFGLAMVTIDFVQTDVVWYQLILVTYHKESSIPLDHLAKHIGISFGSQPMP